MRILAAAFALGAMSVASGHAVADPHHEQGHWSAFADMAQDGSAVCGIRTPLPDGAELRVVADQNGIDLVAYNPGWTIHTNGQADVSIAVGQEVYLGAAAVAGPETLVVPSLTPDFLLQFMRGSMMIADFGGVRWSVGLAGSGRAAAALTACAAGSHRTYAS